jgi:hypothetical protein
MEREGDKGNGEEKREQPAVEPKLPDDVQRDDEAVKSVHREAESLSPSSDVSAPSSDTSTQPAAVRSPLQDAPVSPMDTPAVVPDTPESPEGTPDEPTDTPASPDEAPVRSADTPASPDETPVEHIDSPASPDDPPDDISDTPASPDETPDESTVIPALTDEALAETADTPTSPDTDTASASFPDDTSTQSREAPAQTPDDPSKLPDTQAIILAPPGGAASRPVFHSQASFSASSEEDDVSNDAKIQWNSLESEPESPAKDPEEHMEVEVSDHGASSSKPDPAVREQSDTADKLQEVEMVQEAGSSAKEDQENTVEETKAAEIVPEDNREDVEAVVIEQEKVTKDVEADMNRQELIAQEKTVGENDHQEAVENEQENARDGMEVICDETGVEMSEAGVSENAEKEGAKMQANFKSPKPGSRKRKESQDSTLSDKRARVTATDTWGVKKSVAVKPVQNWKKVIRLPSSMQDRLSADQIFKNPLPTYVPCIPRGTSQRLINYLTEADLEQLCCPGCKDRFLLPSTFFGHVYRKSISLTFTCQPCGGVSLNFSNRCHLKLHVLGHMERDGSGTVAADAFDVAPIDRKEIDHGFLDETYAR